MIEYIKMVRQEWRRLDQQTADLYDSACALPQGEERDALIREWALARGEARGLETSLAILRDYLGMCQEAL